MCTYRSGGVGLRLTALMQLSLSKIQTQRRLKQGIHKRFIPTLVIEVYDTCDYQKLERSTKDWMIRTRILRLSPRTLPVLQKLEACKGIACGQFRI